MASNSNSSTSPSKDLYKILGVLPDATPSDLKTAHREAVLKHHPDIVGQTPQTLEKFREVQEAYKVLSTPDLRSEYDNSIAKLIKRTPETGKVAPGSATAHIYQMQKENFQERVLPNASSSWSDNLPKYRLERWKRIPLAEKKQTRVRPVWNHFTLAMKYTPYLLSVVISAGIYWHFSRPEVRFSALMSEVKPFIVKKPHSPEH